MNATTVPAGTCAARIDHPNWGTGARPCGAGAKSARVVDGKTIPVCGKHATTKHIRRFT